ncbi:MAG: type I phosphomannose isomerase catalytic subunit, partial [Aureibaculum sp.]
MSANYPIKFRPILKKRIWGGDKLVNVLNKKSQKRNIGESWELSDVEGDTSIVVNGKLKGKSIQYLISTYKSALVGKKVYKKFGKKFPLLIKFIDAREALSIQLHPHDKLAKERHNSFGKTEMWYVMDADKEGNLIVGFKKDVTKEQYLEHLENKSLLEIMNVDPVKKGDVYFIPTGRVHSIGAGVLLA